MFQPRAAPSSNGWKARNCPASKRCKCAENLGRRTMTIADLERVAHAMVAPGKGILAADESTSPLKKRFDAIGVESTESSRRDYREFMFRTPAMRDFISGVILYDETIWQNAADGTPLVKLISDAGAVPGIKV